MMSRDNKNHVNAGSLTAVFVFVALLTVSGCSSATDEYTYDETSVVSIPTVAPTPVYIEPICDEYVDADCDGTWDEFDSDADGNLILDEFESPDSGSNQEPNWNSPFDADNDGIPDNVDIDPSNDGFVNPNINPDSVGSPFDADNDGIPNDVDWDIDGDNIPDNNW
jgi:hypothetical protein